MGKSSYLTIRIDPAVKSEATELFNSLGLTTTAAVTVFLQQALNVGGLPFKVEGPINQTKQAKSN